MVIPGVIQIFLVIVGMSITPGKTELKHLPEEIALLQDTMPPSIPVTVKQNCMRRDVIETLPVHSIVHIACYRRISKPDPSQSMLLLHDLQTAPLTVADFISMIIPHPKFTYLSCSAATGRGTTLLDESIQLSAAFQLAGYPSVIRSGKFLTMNLRNLQKRCMLRCCTVEIQ